MGRNLTARFKWEAVQTTRRETEPSSEVEVKGQTWTQTTNNVVQKGKMATKKEEAQPRLSKD